MPSQTLWHSTSLDQVQKQLEVELVTGLSDQEARKRLEKQGRNKIEGRRRKPIWRLFLEQFQDVLIYILLGAIVVTSLMGEYIDAIVILIVILVNATLGVIQEVKAGNAIEALSQLTSPKAVVRRNGKVKEIDSEEIVPGDVVLLEAGVQVPADIRLGESVNLRIEESSLTGESVSVEKTADAELTEENISLGERVTMAFKSTLVTYGRGVGIVVASGMDTEVGKIASMIDEH